MFLRLFADETKRVRRIVAALLVAFIALAPAADAFLCGGETYEIATHMDDAAGGAPAHDSDHEACLHGHCHHGLSVAAFAASAIAAPIDAARAPEWISPPLASRGPSSLDRPPRA